MSTSHLTPATIEALQLPLDQRIDYCYNKRWVPYPDAMAILDQLEQGFKRQRSDRPTNFAIVAPSNNGKSTLLRKFAGMHPVRLVNAEHGEMAACVLRLELPSSPTESAVCSAILHELNIHHAERDPPMKRYMQVLRALEHANVRMLLLDEFNHVANAHGKSSQVLALIKNLCTQGQITLIAAGIETVRNILRSEEQINNRFVTLPLKRWGMTPDYRRLLAAYETVLPLAEPSNLADRELLPTIYSMAGDTIGATVRLVTEAAAYAIRKGYERIDAKVLKDMPFKREGA